MTSSPSENPVSARLGAIRARIAAAAARVGRDPAEVTLLAVSKTKPEEMIVQAHAAGCLDFGENYVQEWRAKADALQELRALRWHYIGHLQRNKVKYLVGRTHRIHSVDRPSLVEEIGRRSVARDLITSILVEVNMGAEAAKSGCPEAELTDLLALAARTDGVLPVGLMAIPPFLEAEEVRPYFQRLGRLHDQARDTVPGLDERFRELSMGMSGDFEVAIEEGATIVRVGTALFGAR